MTKKIYKITFNEVDWDETRGFVVVARDKKRAKELCLGGSNKTEDNIEEFVLLGNAKTTLKEGIVLEDFKAG